MVILGLGIDIVEISRIKKNMNNKLLTERLQSMKLLRLILKIKLAIIQKDLQQKKLLLKL